MLGEDGLKALESKSLEDLYKEGYITDYSYAEGNSVEDEPVVDPEDEPVVDPEDEPVVDPEDEPVVDPEDEPVVDPEDDSPVVDEE